MNCKYCSKLCKHKNSLAQHEIRCRENPNRIKVISNFPKRKKGEGINGYIKAKRNGTILICSNETRTNISKGLKGKKLSEKHRDSISRGMQKAVLEGRQKTPKPGGICRKFRYTNWLNEECTLDGSWELIVAKFLDEQKIIWKRNTERFQYYFENKIHYYIPDFFLKECDLFLEVKGYKTEKDEAKWLFFKKKLAVLRGEDVFNTEKILEKIRALS